jgi:hypothetical protein
MYINNVHINDAQLECQIVGLILEYHSTESNKFASLYFFLGYGRTRKR